MHQAPGNEAAALHVYHSVVMLYMVSWQCILCVIPFQACDNGRGAVLLAIARGKVSEGVDFGKSHHHADQQSTAKGTLLIQ